MNVEVLHQRLSEAEKKIADLQYELERARSSTTDSQSTSDENQSYEHLSSHHPHYESWSYGSLHLPCDRLDFDEYKRYGRQMIVPGFGLQGQTRLKKTKALIIGVGGLGCPAAMYLAAAGVGTLGLMDGDVVELSNLHRQVLHSMETLGMSKVESATKHLRSVNPKVHYQQHPFHLEPTNATDLFKKYDLVLDCTDHPTSRYLISDACVLTNKPLISASALATDGQLLVLNLPPGESPCYRCIWPKPPPANAVTSCGEGGIIGPVVGTMGVLMAAKAIQIIALNFEFPENSTPGFSWKAMDSRILLYSAFDSQPFRSMAFGKKRRNCPACSDHSSISINSLRSGSLDYQVFCGLTTPIRLLKDCERRTPELYRNAADFETHHDYSAEETFREASHDLIDVREKIHFDICHLPGSINIPFSEIKTQAMVRNRRSSSATINRDKEEESYPALETLERLLADKSGRQQTYAVCRFGNDSQEVVQIAKEAFPHLKINESAGYNNPRRTVFYDIKGGLHAWSKMDPTFPEY